MDVYFNYGTESEAKIMDAKETKGLMTVSELSEALHLPKSWIYQRTSMGQKGIPHIKMGKYVRFNLDEVMEFFKNKNQVSH